MALTDLPRSALGGAVDLVRGRLAASAAEPFGHGDPPLLHTLDHPGDPGLFGPDSVAWRVHADLPGMLIGGISALFLQALHPLAMAGVADHSDFAVDPLARLRRTAGFVGTTAYGTAAEAAEACATVRSRMWRPLRNTCSSLASRRVSAGGPIQASSEGSSSPEFACNSGRATSSPCTWAMRRRRSCSGGASSTGWPDGRRRPRPWRTVTSSCVRRLCAAWRTSR